MKITFTPCKKVLSIVIPATLFSVSICAYSSISDYHSIFESSMRHELTAAATLIQNDLQAQMSKAAARASLVVHLPAIQKAFRAGERQQMADILKPAFLLQKERYDVTEAQFFTAPAVTFLRVFDASKGVGSDISGFREMVVNANRNHEPQKGVELGQRTLSIRAIDVVQDDKGYIGCFETGTGFKSVLENLKLNTGFEAGAFVREDLMTNIAILAPKPAAEKIIAGFRNVEATDWAVIKSVVTPELLSSVTEVKTNIKTIAGIDYGTVIVPLLDYKGSNIGSIIAVREFDEYRKQMNAAIVRVMAFSLLQVLVLVGFIIITINVLFVRPASES